MSINWQGIFAIPVTPFTPELSLDIPSLLREVVFSEKRGAAGIVAPVVASEFYTLTDDEREAIYHEVAAELSGRLPFVAGVSGTSGPHAGYLAKKAEEAGADALIAMPPYAGIQRWDTIRAYFHQIAEASGLPLVVQNAPPPLGTPLNADQIGILLDEIPQIVVVKEETDPNPQQIGTVIDRFGDRLAGVFGGYGGIYFLNELSRGASGTMPACQFLEIVDAIWRRWQAGEEKSARELHVVLLPALVMERLYGVAFMKECLVRRGVIACAATRISGHALDPVDRREIDHMWKTLEPHFTTTE